MHATVELNSSSTTQRYSQPQAGCNIAGTITTEPCPLLSPAYTAESSSTLRRLLINELPPSPELPNVSPPEYPPPPPTERRDDY